jgi:hypothetical protein
MSSDRSRSSQEFRAESRRQSWSGGVATSFEDMERIDLEWWLAQSPAERLRAMWGLVEDTLALVEQHGSTPRLQRSVGGVRPLRG